jgi:hypothetical protein
MSHHLRKAAAGTATAANASVRGSSTHTTRMQSTIVRPKPKAPSAILSAVVAYPTSCVDAVTVGWISRATTAMSAPGSLSDAAALHRVVIRYQRWYPNAAPALKAAAMHTMATLPITVPFWNDPSPPSRICSGESNVDTLPPSSERKSFRPSNRFPLQSPSDRISPIRRTVRTLIGPRRTAPTETPPLTSLSNSAGLTVPAPPNSIDAVSVPDVMVVVCGVWEDDVLVECVSEGDVVKSEIEHDVVRPEDVVCNVRKLLL